MTITCFQKSLAEVAVPVLSLEIWQIPVSCKQTGVKGQRNSYFECQNNKIFPYQLLLLSFERVQSRTPGHKSVLT